MGIVVVAAAQELLVHPVHGPAVAGDHPADLRLGLQRPAGSIGPLGVTVPAISSHNASHMEATGVIYAALDCDAEAIEAWNRWYDLEHLPPNLALDGVVWAAATSPLRICTRRAGGSVRVGTWGDAPASSRSTR